MADASGMGAASLATGGAGSLFSGFANSQSAEYNAKIAQQNSALDTREAGIAGEVGNIESANSERQTQEKLGAIKANEGASGVTVGGGSFANVQGTVAQTGMLDAMTIRSSAARQAYGYQVAATSEEAQAKLDKSASRNDLIAGALGAATTVTGGVANGVQSGLFSDKQWTDYSNDKASYSSDQTAGALAMIPQGGY
jgi:hypothetical protein